MITGWKKLTKEELHHVTSDAGCLTNARWKENIDLQRAVLTKTGAPACYFCWRIAQKLGQV